MWLIAAFAGVCVVAARALEVPAKMASPAFWEQNLPHWMTALKQDPNVGSLFLQTKLKELTLVGSHHANTGEVFDNKDIIVPGDEYLKLLPRSKCVNVMLQNQKVSVRNQLERGVRYLDLRPFLLDDDHDLPDTPSHPNVPGTRYLVEHHSVRCTRIDVLMQQVREFLIENPREVIFLEAQFACTSNAQISLERCASHVQALLESVQLHLPQEWLATKSDLVASPADTTLEHLESKGHKLMFWFDRYQRTAEALPSLKQVDYIFDMDDVMYDNYDTVVAHSSLDNIMEHTVSWHVRHWASTPSVVLKAQHFKKLLYDEFDWCRTRKGRDALDRANHGLHMLLTTEWMRDIEQWMKGGFFLVDRIRTEQVETTAMLSMAPMLNLLRVLSCLPAEFQGTSGSTGVVDTIDTSAPEYRRMLDLMLRHLADSFENATSDLSWHQLVHDLVSEF